ncbi:hypothetical protein G6F29_007732 [Rhizopus arrhizus]|nr:hypothetical protein G6F20_007896 [Rhizopus arrhizus]KAG0828803.1 hypothetical protein G6F19_008069 [Rhizopus arrhizus]KAG0894959.1 hypothetical protein G6F34_008650 [Rhizopus arrhizus]KAG0909340.1 hypothetical protein G6F33_008877 [Rhizopus arrhizus]KAG0980560.1 hypothetical protein G6F29_007732 [Rhizopus arrhizus]
MYRVKRDSRNQIKTILESMATMPVETPSDKVYHVKADCISDVRVVSIVFDDEHPSYVHATDFHAAGLEYEKSKHPMDLSDCIKNETCEDIDYDCENEDDDEDDGEDEEDNDEDDDDDDDDDDDCDNEEDGENDNDDNDMNESRDEDHIHHKGNHSSCKHWWKGDIESNRDHQWHHRHGDWWHKGSGWNCKEKVPKHCQGFNKSSTVISTLYLTTTNNNIKTRTTTLRGTEKITVIVTRPPVIITQPAVTKTFYTTESRELSTSRPNETTSSSKKGTPTNTLTSPTNNTPKSSYTIPQTSSDSQTYSYGISSSSKSTYSECSTCSPLTLSTTKSTSSNSQTHSHRTSSTTKSAPIGCLTCSPGSSSATAPTNSESQTYSQRTSSTSKSSATKCSTCSSMTSSTLGSSSSNSQSHLSSKTSLASSSRPSDDQIRSSEISLTTKTTSLSKSLQTLSTFSSETQDTISSSLVPTSKQISSILPSNSQDFSYISSLSAPSSSITTSQTLSFSSIGTSGVPYNPFILPPQIDFPQGQTASSISQQITPSSSFVFQSPTSSYQATTKSTTLQQSSSLPATGFQDAPTNSLSSIIQSSMQTSSSSSSFSSLPQQNPSVVSTELPAVSSGRDSSLPQPSLSASPSNPQDASSSSLPSATGSTMSHQSSSVVPTTSQSASSNLPSTSSSSMHTPSSSAGTSPVTHPSPSTALTDLQSITSNSLSSISSSIFQESPATSSTGLQGVPTSSLPQSSSAVSLTSLQSVSLSGLSSTNGYPASTSISSPSGATSQQSTSTVLTDLQSPSSRSLSSTGSASVQPSLSLTTDYSISQQSSPALPSSLQTSLSSLSTVSSSLLSSTLPLTCQMSSVLSSGSQYLSTSLPSSVNSSPGLSFTSSSTPSLIQTASLSTPPVHLSSSQTHGSSSLLTTYSHSLDCHLMSSTNSASTSKPSTFLVTSRDTTLAPSSTISQSTSAASCLQVTSSSSSALATPTGIPNNPSVSPSVVSCQLLKSNTQATTNSNCIGPTSTSDQYPASSLTSPITSRIGTNSGIQLTSILSVTNSFPQSPNQSSSLATICSSTGTSSMSIYGTATTNSPRNSLSQQTMCPSELVTQSATTTSVGTMSTASSEELLLPTTAGDTDQSTFSSSSSRSSSLPCALIVTSTYKLVKTFTTTYSIPSSTGTPFGGADVGTQYPKESPCSRTTCVQEGSTHADQSNGSSSSSSNSSNGSNKNGDSNSSSSGSSSSSGNSGSSSSSSSSSSGGSSGNSGSSSSSSSSSGGSSSGNSGSNSSSSSSGGSSGNNGSSSSSTTSCSDGICSSTSSNSSSNDAKNSPNRHNELSENCDEDTEEQIKFSSNNRPNSYRNRPTEEQLKGLISEEANNVTKNKLPREEFEDLEEGELADENINSTKTKVELMNTEEANNSEKDKSQGIEVILAEVKETGPSDTEKAKPLNTNEVKETDIIEAEAETNKEEKTLGEEIQGLQNLMKQIRKKHGIIPSFSKKRSAGDCEFVDETQAKRTKIEDEVLPLMKDRGKLMNRLRTYQYIFFHKPRPLTALECAKYGWVHSRKVIESDPSIAVLNCTECDNNMFVIDVDFQQCTKIQAMEVRKKYSEGLSGWHKEDCIWRDDHCSALDDIYNFPVITLSEGINRLKREGKNISSYQIIPPIQKQTDDAFLKRIRYIIRDAEGLSDNDDINNNILNAYLLASFGWQSIDVETPGIRCDLCFAHKFFYNDQEALDAINTHHIYCPWRNSDVACALSPKKSYQTQKLSGFEWMIQVVYIEYDLLIRRHHFGYYNQYLKDEAFKKSTNEIIESRKSLDEIISINNQEKIMK